MKAEKTRYHINRTDKWLGYSTSDVVWNELEELERIATEYESNKHYIELGKAIQKAYNLENVEFITVKDFEGGNVKFFYSLEHLIEWAEGRE